MITLTEKAVARFLEMLTKQDPQPFGVRIAVVGGGCSGFSYHMEWAEAKGALDKEFSFGENGALKIYIDQASLLYLEGVAIDFVETLEGVGFKFDNPHVKSTCGCGSSFQA